MYVNFQFFHSSFRGLHTYCLFRCLFPAVCLVLSLVGCAPGAATKTFNDTSTQRFFQRGEDSVYVSRGPYLHPVPLKAGQYVVYGIEWKGERSALSLRVVRLHGDVATLDVFSLTRRKETALTFKVRGLAAAIQSGDFDNVQIVETRYTDDRGLTRAADTREIMWSSGLFTRLENLFNQPCVDSVRLETVKVGANTFQDATSCVSINSLPGFVSYMKVWKHPSVPLNGLVKWETGDGKLKARLLDFKAM